MLLQTAATFQDRRSIGTVPAGTDNCLFADCPELIGAKLTYGRDGEIYGEAEEAEFVYKVVSGAVRTYKLLSDGRRQIGSFLLPGDLFGFESSTTHRPKPSPTRRCWSSSAAPSNISRCATSRWRGICGA